MTKAIRRLIEFVAQHREIFSAVFGMLFGLTCGLLCSCSRAETEAIRFVHQLPLLFQWISKSPLSVWGFAYYFLALSCVFFSMAIPNIFFSFMPLQNETELNLYRVFFVIGMVFGHFVRRIIWDSQFKRGFRI